MIERTTGRRWIYRLNDEKLETFAICIINYTTGVPKGDVSASYDRKQKLQHYSYFFDEKPEVDGHDCDFFGAHLDIISWRITSIAWLICMIARETFMQSRTTAWR